MILNNLLIPLFVMTYAQLSEPRDGFDYTYRIGCSGLLESLVSQTSTNRAVMVKCEYFYDGLLVFNKQPNSSSSNPDFWYITDNTLRFNVYYYYLDTYGDASEEDSLTYSFHSDYIIDNDSLPYWTYYTFTYGLDDDDLFIRCYDSSDDLVAERTTEVDDTISYSCSASYQPDNSYLQYTAQQLVDIVQLNYASGYSSGHIEGYGEGVSDGTQSMATTPEMFTIFNGILNVAMIPVNVFLGIFNWEVFGINIASLISSLLSIAILIIVIRLIAGSSAKGNS